MLQACKRDGCVRGAFSAVSRSGRLGGIRVAWPVASTEMTAGMAARSPAASARERNVNADVCADVEQRDLRLTHAVAASQRGDEASFAVVYRAVQPGLLRYLSALVGPDCEDVASETWAQVCRDLHKFDGDGDGFRGWVATIGRHRALDHVRARGRRPVDPAPIEAFLDRAANDDTAMRATESLSTQAAVALIALLPQDQAEAVLLRAVMGLDAKSAGRVLGKRPGAVRTASYRGLQTLARLLAGGQR